MDAQELLADLQRLGVILAADGEQMQVDAPEGVITPAIRAELHRRKAELLAQLDQADPSMDVTGDGVREAPPEERPSGIAAEATGARVVTELLEPTEKEPQLSEPPAPWAGRRVDISDLAAFKAEWGLRSVGSEWPAGDPCPKLYLAEVR